MRLGMRLLLNDCRSVVATPAAPRSMAESGPAGTSELGGELTYQRHEVAGSADPITGLAVDQIGQRTKSRRAAGIAFSAYQSLWPRCETCSSAPTICSKAPNICSD